MDETLDILLEETEDAAPIVPRRRLPWRWVMIGAVGGGVAGLAVLVVLVVVPAIKGGGKDGRSPIEALRASAGLVEEEAGEEGGSSRWDRLFDLDEKPSPTGPDIIGGEAGIPAEETEGLLAPDPETVMPLGKAEGKCGYESQEPGPETAGYRLVHGTLGTFGSLYALLHKNGIGPNAIAEITGVLEKVTDPKAVRAEDKFRLYIDEKSGKLKFLELKRSDTKIYHVLAFDNGTVDAHKVTVPTERKWVKAGGVVKGSLFGSAREAGLEGSIVNHFMAVFGAYAKFASDSREGDTFRVIVSGEWLGKQFLGYDPPQILEFNGQKTGKLLAIYYESSPGKGKYYWPDGTSLKRLVADVPLQVLRITSPFDPKRMHPMLKVRKPHLGTDFGAPSGTPVFAFDSGVVKKFGMKGAMGNMIQVDHGGGISTYYGHLSGFAKGLKAGKKVKKGETIGFVGNTGRSTGPHLHFGLKKGKAFVDPMKYLKVTTIKEKPIDKSLVDGFEKRAKTLHLMLKAIKVPDLPAKASAKKAAQAKGKKSSKGE
ncbi:MAG: M23 family metallopeptidase [Deltaproteobacteria bacterium]|nr:M23 family metallopeptidase [Deltaproteobacteria bacterium]